MLDKYYKRISLQTRDTPNVSFIGVIVIVVDLN